MYSTRSNDGLLRLARMYVEMGFTFIPLDGAVNFNDSDRTRLLRIMDALWEEKETIAKLAGRPSRRGTRAPLIGRSVGSDYINLVKEYEGNFGKKKSRQKKTVQARKTSSAAQKKSRSDAKKAMNMMWKEGITLKQAWKKVKRATKKA